MLKIRRNQIKSNTLRNFNDAGFHIFGVQKSGLFAGLRGGFFGVSVFFCFGTQIEVRADVRKSRLCMLAYEASASAGAAAAAAAAGSPAFSASSDFSFLSPSSPPASVKK